MNILDRGMAACLLDALDDIEAADALGMSVPVVRESLKRLYQQTGARNRVALALTLERMSAGFAWDGGLSETVGGNAGNSEGTGGQDGHDGGRRVEAGAHAVDTEAVPSVRGKHGPESSAVRGLDGGRREGRGIRCAGTAGGNARHDGSHGARATARGDNARPGRSGGLLASGGAEICGGGKAAAACPDIGMGSDKSAPLDGGVSVGVGRKRTKASADQSIAAVDKLQAAPGDQPSVPRDNQYGIRAYNARHWRQNRMKVLKAVLHAGNTEGRRLFEIVRRVKLSKETTLKHLAELVEDGEIEVTDIPHSVKRWGPKGTRLNWAARWEVRMYWQEAKHPKGKRRQFVPLDEPVQRVVVASQATPLRPVGPISVFALGTA